MSNKKILKTKKGLVEISREDFEDGLHDCVDLLQKQYLDLLSLKQRYEEDKSSSSFNIKYFKDSKNLISYTKVKRKSVGFYSENSKSNL